ncbi:3-deoxy-8-phosphooctulonate synthase [Octadecabacter ascidiaceicola]|uniref:2-dehydro-3-deoxyphosphooctonate aldolase n=1 Tax=Octadecabacter ascidiaceicola TaxID=1655543 RepID=A0A238KPY5_9RHOB|nr:3-deoxy-8-phosphooctulonate synthase [Octadecabacter ascidiaceicola]SMX44855.1 2-dehydro-3-deoxyphosphooctonate aldolase [Octadecabacter ascidiaceicola]
MKDVKIGSITASNDRPLTVIAGPCQLESLDHARMIASEMARVCDANGAQFVFKGSYDKANRTSLSGKRGLGLDEGLAIHAAIKAEFGCPVLTDIHTAEQCAPVAEVVDILQIPAFLCRQTDLLIAAGETGAVVNVKKGQFLAPWDMANVVGKIESTGNERIMLTERGVSFGYNALVADMRSLPEMMKTGYPVVMDATHAVAQPGGLGGSSGGQREFAPVLARAAVAQGIGAVFLETHEDPDNAPSDGPNMIALSDMDSVMKTLMAIDAVAKADPIRL